MTVDPVENEVYVADGYGNRRVIVFDADTGEYRRHWGAYGNRPDDDATYNGSGATVGSDYDPDLPPATQFGRAVHGVALSADRTLYVADRVNNRVQAFQTDGTFIKEGFVDKATRGFGSVFELAFSKDASQRFLYNPNGMNQSVDILDRGLTAARGEVRTGRSLPRSVLLGSQHCGGFPRQHLHGRDARGEALAAVRPAGPLDSGPLWPGTRLR